MVTESELIELMRSMAGADSFPWLKVGIGDDAAELAVGDGQRLLLTTDMVVAGVHFAEDTGPELIGRKAIARGGKAAVHGGGGQSGGHRG